MSGYVFKFNNGAISWYYQQQKTVALSTIEAEYIACTQAAKEALWLRTILTELDRPCETPTIIYSDNQSAIALAKNAIHHARSKHIDIRYHFIRDLISALTIELAHIPTDRMTADIFTKALPRTRHHAICDELGMH